MKTRSLTIVLSAVTTLAVCGQSMAGSSGFPQTEWQEGLIAVRLADNVAVADVLVDLAADYPRATLVDSIDSRHTHLINLNAGDLNAADVQTTFAAYDGLLWVELVHNTQSPEGVTVNMYADQQGNIISVFDPVVIPASATFWFSDLSYNDYRNQYAGGQLGIGEAHEYANGESMVVAVLDTGVDPVHRALDEYVLEDGYNAMVPGGSTHDVPASADTDGDGLADELAGHGTFLAGLVRYVAPEAMLLPVVVQDTNGRGNVFDLAEGIFFAIDRGVEVILIGTSTHADSMLLEDALAEAETHGIVVVAPAGNLNVSQPMEYPAGMPNVLGVAAIDNLGQRVDFSNYHNQLALSAPGNITDQAFLPLPVKIDPSTSVISTMPGNEYAMWEGSSMSAAYVAGAAAVVRSQVRNLSYTADTAALVRQRLTDAAVNIDAMNPGYENQLGAGRLNLMGALMEETAPQPGDLTGNGVVDSFDLLELLNAWGDVHSPADFDGNGTVGSGDLLILLNAWDD